MFATTDNLMHQFCPVPDESGGVFLSNDASLMAGRNSFVPALPHTSRPASIAPTHSHSETDRCLRRSYALVEKLRHAVSL